MKNFATLVFLLFATLSNAFAQNCTESENFNGFSNGDFIAEETNSVWTVINPPAYYDGIISGQVVNSGKALCLLSEGAVEGNSPQTGLKYEPHNSISNRFRFSLDILKSLSGDPGDIYFEIWFTSSELIQVSCNDNGYLEIFLVTANGNFDFDHFIGDPEDWFNLSFEFSQTDILVEIDQQEIGLFPNYAFRFNHVLFYGGSFGCYVDNICLEEISVFLCGNAYELDCNEDGEEVIEDSNDPNDNSFPSTIATDDVIFHNHCVDTYDGCDTDNSPYSGYEFYGGEVLYKHQGGYDGHLVFDIHWGNDNYDLDLFVYEACYYENGLTDCVVSSTYGDTEFESVIIEDGADLEHYVLVDGFQDNDQTDFSISMTCGDLEMHDKIPLECGQLVYGNTSWNDKNYNSFYCNCDFQNENVGRQNYGPEDVYEFTIYESGFTAITLTIEDPDVDLNLYLLDECDVFECNKAADFDNPGKTEIIDFNGAVNNMLPPGTYTLVVEGYRGDKGAYTLLLEHISCQVDCLDNCCQGQDLSWLDQLIEGELISSCEDNDPSDDIVDGAVLQGAFDGQCAFAVVYPKSIFSLNNFVEIYDCSGILLDIIQGDVIDLSDFPETYWSCENHHEETCCDEVWCDYYTYTPNVGISSVNTNWIQTGINDLIVINAFTISWLELVEGGGAQFTLPFKDIHKMNMDFQMNRDSNGFFEGTDFYINDYDQNTLWLRYQDWNVFGQRLDVIYNGQVLAQDVDFGPAFNDVIEVTIQWDETGFYLWHGEVKIFEDSGLSNALGINKFEIHSGSGYSVNNYILSICLEDCGDQKTCYTDCCSGEDKSWLESLKESYKELCNDCDYNTMDIVIRQNTYASGFCLYEIEYRACEQYSSDVSVYHEYYTCDGTFTSEPVSPLESYETVWDCDAGDREKCCIEPYFEIKPCSYLSLISVDTTIGIQYIVQVKADSELDIQYWEFIKLSNSTTELIYSNDHEMSFLVDPFIEYKICVYYKDDYGCLFKCCLEYFTASENLDAGFISVFPNPVSDFLNIKISNEAGAVDIQLKDLHGLKIQEYRSVSGDIQLSCSSLPPGIYLLSITDTKGRSRIERIIII